MSLFDHEGNKVQINLFYFFIKVWKKQVQDVFRHRGAVNRVVMDDRGEVVGSCGEDGFVKVTSLFGDEEQEQKMKFRQEVTGIALAPDYADSGRIVIGSDKVSNELIKYLETDFSLV